MYILRSKCTITEGLVVYLKEKKYFLVCEYTVKYTLILTIYNFTSF